MEEMGHTDPGLALRVYAQAMRRGENETAQLRALVEAGLWPTVANAANAANARLRRTQCGWLLDAKPRDLQGVFPTPPPGVEPGSTA